MRSVTWAGFCMANSLTRTILHLYPSAGNVSAPYPVTCKLSLFGGDSVSRSITVEGARLSNPDGFRLDQVFPELAEGSGALYGIEITLSSVQPKIDISSSECVIEFVSPVQNTRYKPKKIGAEDGGQESSTGSGIFIEDGLQTSSCVVVNTGSSGHSLALAGSRKADDGNERIKIDFAKAEIPGRSAVEIKPDRGAFDICKEVDLASGSSRLGAVSRVAESDDQAIYYMLYRDAKNNSAVSVCAL